MSIEDIKNTWVVFAGIVSALVAGLVHAMKLNTEVVRLRDRQGDLEKESEKKEAYMQGKIESLQDTMTSILQSLARLEGKLESHRGRDIPKQ